MAKIRSMGFGEARRATRLWLTGLMLLAFLFQGYVSQTHIHPLQGIPGLTKLTDMAAQKAPGGKTNAADDCALCQLAQDGQTIVPDVPLLLLSVLAAYAALHLTYYLPMSRAVSHDWRGRAPPRV